MLCFSFRNPHAVIVVFYKNFGLKSAYLTKKEPFEVYLKH